jgi:hypothetical protein
MILQRECRVHVEKLITKTNIHFTFWGKILRVSSIVGLVFITMQNPWKLVILCKNEALPSGKYSYLIENQGVKFCVLPR